VEPLETEDFMHDFIEENGYARENHQAEGDVPEIIK